MKTALSLHGPPTLKLGNQYLTYEDGTPFFWLADTWWYGMTRRMSLSVFRKLAIDRVKKGFTVIQCVIGVPPEIRWNDENAGNVGGLPFLPDKTLNLKYFEEVDKKIELLVQNGLVPCIVGGWGHHIDEIGEIPMQQLWKEIVRRYASYPVVWCLTGEVDLIPPKGYASSTLEHLSSLHPLAVLKNARIYSVFRRIKQRLISINTRKLSQQMDRRIQAWSRIALEIKKTQSTPRLLTVHPQSQKRVSQILHNPNWLDVDAIQSGHSIEAIQFIKYAIEQSRKEKKAIINMESLYEGILGNYDDSQQRYAFWTSILSGAAGYSYGAHGLWQMATESDKFMGHWGLSNWEEAYQYPGGKQLGLLKRFLTKYPWWRIVPYNNSFIPHKIHYQRGEPLCGHIDNATFFIYVPSTTSSTKYVWQLPDNDNSYLVKEYIPSSLATVRAFRVNSKTPFKFSSTTTDLLFTVIKMANLG